MRKETLALILLECLLCTAQNGPPSMGPAGPPMGPAMGYMSANIDQLVGAPPNPPSDEQEQQYQGYYMAGAQEQNLGAPPPLDMDNQQQYQGYQYGAEQMVGGPLEDLLRVRQFFRV